MTTIVKLFDNRKDKLRAVTLRITEYNIKTGKKVSNDKPYILDGNVLVTKGFNMKDTFKEHGFKGYSYLVKIPVKYTKSGIIGLESDSDQIIFRTLMLEFICDRERNGHKDLKESFKLLNKFRKKADKEYFNNFHNTDVEIHLGIMRVKSYTFICKMEMKFKGYTTIQYFGKKLKIF